MLRSAFPKLANAQFSFRFFSSAADFEKAQKNLKKLPNEPDVDTKLKLYGLFKQSTVGDVTGSRPGAFDFAGRAKFDVWKSQAGLSQEEAQKKYVELVESLLKKANVNDSSDKAESNIPTVEGIDVSKEGKVFKITLNRPTKFNAITWEMYDVFTNALNAANVDNSAAVTVISAKGPYYCSGNDLSNFTKIKSPSEMKELAERGEKVLEEFVKAHITHKKPLITLVNGPAIGISVTVLALSDLVIASDKATFQTPFSALGQSPEGCSSYTFPALMGTSKASEMLLFGKKITAEEALERNLIGKIIPHAHFHEECEKIISQYAELPPESLRLNKQLIRNVHVDRLIDVNVKECAFLRQRWLSAECHQALANFMNRKK